MHQQQKSRRSGFTIIELLIVIVVIAVLAAITFVAYNGIQIRSKNTQTMTSVASYVRTIKAFYSTNQRFPGPNLTVSCFGKSGTVCGNITDGTNTDCAGIGPASYQAAFGSDMATIATSLPEPSNQSVSCSGKQYTGVIYVNYGTLVIMYVFLNGISSCQNVGGASIYAAGTGTFGSGYVCTYQIDG